jgi:recombinational DNA repair protein (RecF pathway)
VLAAARAERGRALREIDSLLREYPGALLTTPAAYPLVLVRLAHALIAAGYLTVAAPACAGCGRITADLQRKTASGRVCGTCAARRS